METGNERLTGRDDLKEKQIGNGETEEWEEWEAADPGYRGGKKRKRGEYRLTGSLPAKIVAFFLLAASCLTGAGGIIVCLYMGVEGVYTEKLNTVMMNMMQSECRSMVYQVESYIEQGNIREAGELFLESNLGMELIDPEGEGGEEVVWSVWDGGLTNLITDAYLRYDQREKTVRINGHTLEDGKLFLARIYVDPEFPWDDDLKRIADLAVFLYENRNIITVTAVSCSLLCLICFLFLICGAGHQNGKKGIVPGPLTTIHLDVLTVIFMGAALLFAGVVLNTASSVNTMTMIVLLAAAGTVLAVWLTFYFMDFALRVKMGKCWRYSVIYIVLRWLWKAFCFLGRELVKLVLGLPLVVTTVNVYLGICILELMGVLWYIRDSNGFLLWALEKIILLPVVMYIALAFRKLLQASRALAEGQGNYQVDTSRMIGAFREHGENLNSLALGISRAVEERTKSERMKTELISNVSHDLKTPLTSIINYADLIWEEVNGDGEPGEARAAVFQEQFPADTADSGVSGDKGKIREYAEVLLRQSRRLKKLMDDLMEASKATTGNLEVVLEPCQVGVMLSQAVGEYQQKMEEKELELIARQPKEGVTVLADGRRLWRIFENLLNNICKYAQEGSRVYLSVEVREEQVLIIFRNMSKYPLDISGEELEERFVRGDKSRHMEGNGLGLSIAKSLVELQNGQMEIVIDGDLFKVVLKFPLFSL